jgi:hypothetical protein
VISKGIVRFMEGRSSGIRGPNPFRPDAEHLCPIVASSIRGD